MKNRLIYNQVSNLKKILLVDGFIIDGIFGSYARGEETAHVM